LVAVTVLASTLLLLLHPHIVSHNLTLNFMNCKSFFAVFTLGLLVCAGTTHAQVADTQTIVDVAAGNSDKVFAELVSALQSQELVDTLAGSGPFTVFAPTNDAFAALPEGAQDALAENPELLTDILLYHVVPGFYSSEDVLGTERIETLYDSEFNELAVQTTDAGDFVNTAELIALDIEASNGIIHAIDTVLLPPEILVALADGHVRINVGAFEDYTDPSGNVWAADFGFVGGNTVDRGDIAVDGTELDELFQTERWNMDAYEIPVPDGSYDVVLHFAETYSGIDDEGKRIFDVVVQDEVSFDDLDVFREADGFETAIFKSAEAVPVSNGSLGIAFQRDPHAPMINAIEVIAHDAGGSDEPPLPPEDGPEPPNAPDSPDGPTIADAVSASDEFSALAEALGSAELVATLDGDGPFTVFAPDNDAFATLPTYLSDVLARKPSLLSEILLYHVVGDALSSSEVLAAARIETVQGEQVRVAERGGAAFVNNSELTELDINLANGIVHGVDRVLVPQAVYYEVLLDIRQQLFDLVDRFREVQQDRFEERFPNQ